MATDQTQPRLGLIVRIGALSIIMLIVVRVSLAAYFDHIAQAEEHRKVGEAKPEGLISLRADETQRLNGGPMPIDSAMHALVQKGRMAMSPELVPTPSHDVAPLKGWVRMPAETPVVMEEESDGGSEAPAAARPVDAGPAKGDAAPPKAAGAVAPHK
jgi:hypothetical protein